MNIEEIIKQQIDELTDFDVETLSPDTQLADIGLASLDFLSIQVAIKRNMGIEIDLNHLAAANLTTFSDLTRYLEESYSHA